LNQIEEKWRCFSLAKWFAKNQQLHFILSKDARKEVSKESFLLQTSSTNGTSKDSCASIECMFLLEAAGKENASKLYPTFLFNQERQATSKQNKVASFRRKVHHLFPAFIQ
jgi:hypothetical protein